MTLGVGVGLAILAAIFFVPFLHAKVIKKDNTLKWYHIFMGPLLWSRVAPAGVEQAVVPNYAVVQEDKEHEFQEYPSPSGSFNPENASDGDFKSTQDFKEPQVNETPYSDGINHLKNPEIETNKYNYKQLQQMAEDKFHARLRTKKGPLGWAMRFLHNNPMGAGQLYEIHNIKRALVRLPAQVTVGALYGINYDIHAAQHGVEGTPDGERMKSVYSHAKQYSNEVEHTYSFVQIITACTASFAHGANDVGNSVGPWAVIYGAWHTGSAAAKTAPVPLWQLAVLSLTISLGFCRK